jgi:hypothetical protein
MRFCMHDRYNALFQLLLRLRRAALALEGAWVTLAGLAKDEARARSQARARIQAPYPTRASQGGGGGGGRAAAAAAAVAPPTPSVEGPHVEAALLQELLHLRLAMAHVVTNLQIYIQVKECQSISCLW